MPPDLFGKIAVLSKLFQTYDFIKERLQSRCFPVNHANNSEIVCLR